MIEPKRYYVGFNFNADSSITEEELKRHISLTLFKGNIWADNFDFHECTKLETTKVAIKDSV